MTMARVKNAVKKRQHTNQPNHSLTLPFSEHVRELRKRLFYISVSVGIFSAAAYSVEHFLITALLKPAGHQNFIYTSPGGGIDFLFTVCLYVGVACSIPVIIYQFLRYIEPLLTHSTRAFVMWGSAISGVLALIGMTFGYFVGLPSALHFLLHQFTSNQIQALLTIQSYMSFVAMYILGSALLLQVPLILIFINRIKPLKPQKLYSFSAQRWVIVGALLGSALMNPNPNPFALLTVAGPMILAYEVGVFVIWYINQGMDRNESPYIKALLAEDTARQVARAARATNMQPIMKVAPIQPQPIVVARKDITRSVSAPQTQQRQTPSPTQPLRPRRYVNDFVPRQRAYNPTMQTRSEGFGA